MRLDIIAVLIRHSDLINDKNICILNKKPYKDAYIYVLFSTKITVVDYCYTAIHVMASVRGSQLRTSIEKGIK